MWWIAEHVNAFINALIWQSYFRLQFHQRGGRRWTSLYTSPESGELRVRDVMKFEFEFSNVRTLNECFWQIWNLTNVSNLLSHANLWKNPCSTTDFICTYRARECRQTCFFSQIQLITHTLQLSNVQYNFCSVMC